MATDLSGHVREPLICTCIDCGRRYAYDYRKGHTKRRCNSCRSNRRVQRDELKRRMVASKGGCCQICGYDRCPRALDFHHLDPTTKRFGFAGNHLRKWEAIQEELVKCVLVCSNCHDELEAGVAEIPGSVADAIRRATAHMPRHERRRPGRPALS